MATDKEWIRLWERAGQDADPHIVERYNLVRLAVSWRPSVDAEVTFLPTEEGGRRTLPDLSECTFPPRTYMPHIVVQSPDIRQPKTRGNEILDDYLGVAFVGGSRVFEAGKAASVTLSLMYHPEVNYDALQPGVTFTLREGGQIIGFGRVIERTEPQEHN
jgi:hypothetical protein